MRISDYINSRVFNIKDNSYRLCLVEDLKNHIFYTLKNDLAQKWENADDIEKFLFEIRNL